uniref:Uncharacterized protein n=1 Tax=Phlebotomus papatasi TaxID=29031 RepID=A0A8W9BHA8_PHLPP
ITFNQHPEEIREAEVVKDRDKKNTFS